MLVSRVLSQCDIIAGGAPCCSAIAVLFGDEVLTRPAAPRVDVCARRGVDLWLALTSSMRKARAAAVTSQLLTVHEVLRDTVDTRTAAPRWRVALEVFGLHAAAAPNDALREYLAAVSGVTRESADSAAYPFETAADLDAALERVVARADAERRSLAATVTFGDHTVAFAVAYDTWASEYHAYDSLRGMWLRGDEARDIITTITTTWCPRVAAVPAFSAEETKLAAFNSPGMFTVVAFTLASSTTTTAAATS
jgi:hypothetical protein